MFIIFLYLELFIKLINSSFSFLTLSYNSFLFFNLSLISFFSFSNFEFFSFNILFSLFTFVISLFKEINSEAKTLLSYLKDKIESFVIELLLFVLVLVFKELEKVDVVKILFVLIEIFPVLNNMLLLLLFVGLSTFFFLVCFGVFFLFILFEFFFFGIEFLFSILSVCIAISFLSFFSFKIASCKFLNSSLIKSKSFNLLSLISFLDFNFEISFCIFSI